MIIQTHNIIRIVPGNYTLSLEVETYIKEAVLTLQRMSIDLSLLSEYLKLYGKKSWFSSLEGRILKAMDEEKLAMLKKGATQSSSAKTNGMLYLSTKSVEPAEHLDHTPLLVKSKKL